MYLFVWRVVGEMRCCFSFVFVTSMCYRYLVFVLALPAQLQRTRTGSVLYKEQPGANGPRSGGEQQLG